MNPHPLRREAGPLPTALAVLLAVGALLGCAKLAEPDRPSAGIAATSDLCRAAGKNCIAEFSDARRKAKSVRKARRTRDVFRADSVHPKDLMPPRIDPNGPLGRAMAAIPPAYRVERAHQDVPARFLGAELMQPVRAEFITLAAFAATQPSGRWHREIPQDRATPWQHTAGGKASILATFLAAIAAFVFVPGLRSSRIPRR